MFLFEVKLQSNGLKYLVRKIMNMGGGQSYLVFHYSPSVLTASYNLSMLLFPLCEDPQLRDENKPECMFSPRRRAKVIIITFDNSSKKTNFGAKT